MIFVFVISDDDRNIVYEIYSKYHKRMLYIASQILGKERGEEAVHDVFVKIMDKHNSIDQNLGDKPGLYFVVMTRNHALNILKKEIKDNLPLDGAFESGDIFQQSKLSPEEILLSTDTMNRLVSLIRMLTPATRQLLEYRFIEGYSNIEIARLLGISQSAVSTGINKARTRLKELIEREEALNHE